MMMLARELGVTMQARTLNLMDFMEAPWDNPEPESLYANLTPCENGRS